jgi:hypothetical protein
VPDSADEDNQMKKWLRDTLRVDKAWIGISIKNKNPSTTFDQLKWADGTPVNELAINNWVVKDMAGYVK